MQSTLLFCVKLKHGTDKRVIKSGIYVPIILVVFLLLLSTGNADAISTDSISSPESTITSTHDTDGDGINNTEETRLGTDANNKYGDKDADGLYDFEEILDIYGSNNVSNPKYKYNVSTTYEDVLDIYHSFNLNSNKTGYIRDSINTTQTTGFTNYLLWNVTFSGRYAGGSDSTSVLYQDNLIINVTFSSLYAGGTKSYRVEYRNNIIRDVKLSGSYAGGSETGDVIYQDNFFENVEFPGYTAGGAAEPGVENYNGFDTTYLNNSLINAELTGTNAGGSIGGSVKYESNFIKSTRIRGGGRADVVYKNNHIVDVNFYNTEAGGSSGKTATNMVKYEANTLENVIFNETNAGGGASATSVSYLRNNLTNVIFNGTDAGLSQNGTTTYMHNLFTNVSYSGITEAYENSTFVLANNSISDDNYDIDNDGLGDARELFVLGTNPVLSDTDGDKLADKWEAMYDGASGVDAVVPANNTELASDTDDDGLNLTEEFKANTNPSLNDTDGDGLNDSYEVFITTDPLDNDTDNDGLNDAYEVTYTNISGVDPVDPANNTELASDMDKDGLNLTEEFKANTNPSLNDTDGDGLNDGLEVFITTDPLDNDTDNDGLNDGLEVLTLGSNPILNDTDGDGLNDSYELILETDLRLLDSDGDKLTDGYEVNELGTNPRNKDTDNDGLDDRYEDLNSMTNPVLFDTDFDGLNDSYEVLITMTDPLLIDTDGDRLTDSFEILLGTNPKLSDTDGDGLNDAWEVTYEDVSGVDPLKRATSFEIMSDLDNDGLTLLEEAMINSDPNDFDTDGDRMGDGWELQYLNTLGVHPLIGAIDFEINLDLDGDGLTLLEEGLAGTNPNMADTDDDGLIDGWEVAFAGSVGVNPFVKVTAEELGADEDNDGLSTLEESMAGTNPASSDSDGDGLGDLWEVTYKGARGVDSIVKATSQELLYDQDGDGYNLLEEALMDTDPEQANIVDSQSNDFQLIGLTLPWVIVFSIFLVTLVSGITLAIIQWRKSQREKKWETLL